MVCKPHACPFFRSASLQTIGFQSGEPYDDQSHFGRRGNGKWPCRLYLGEDGGRALLYRGVVEVVERLKIIERKDGKYQLARAVKAVAIPSTIQDMIMARVDSLPDATRTVLQTGSVIEREFPYDLIKRIVEFRVTENL
jgi:hypothetical protein